MLFLDSWGFILAGLQQLPSSAPVYSLYNFSSFSSSIITITYSVKMPFLLQSNYHQPVSLSLHNGCQETLRAPVQKLALDPQPPNWDNVCTLTVEGKNVGEWVCWWERGGVWGGRLWSLPLPFKCWGNWEIKSNSKSLVSIIQTERERRRRETEKERDQEGRREEKAALIIPLSYRSATVITAKCMSSSFSQHPKTLFRCSDNYCYGNCMGCFIWRAETQKRRGRKKEGIYWLLTWDREERVGCLYYRL